MSMRHARQIESAGDLPKFVCRHGAESRHRMQTCAAGALGHEQPSLWTEVGRPQVAQCQQHSDAVPARIK